VIDAAKFLEASNTGGPFQAVLMRYAQPLMTHDRVDGDRFELRREVLGLMLGPGRQAVNEAAQRQQDGGVISLQPRRRHHRQPPGL
jgi:hypothetical protein